MGLSDNPSEHEYDFFFTQRTKDLSDLLEQLRVRDNITLVVHDWGGMIGMLYANQFPDRIKRIVILNTGAFHLPKDKSLPMSIRLGHTPGINSILIQGFNTFCKGAIKHCVTHPMAPEIARAYLAPYNNWHNRLAVRRFVEDIPLKPDDRGYDEISGINHSDPVLQSIPKLICWGMQDFVFDETFLRVWQTLYPDAEVHPFENAGHYILEDAGDDIVTLVRKFLSRHSIEKSRQN
jgi:pimeloyl-ACP methyl ester carboxylesterase